MRTQFLILNVKLEGTPTFLHHDLSKIKAESLVVPARANQHGSLSMQKSLRTKTRS